MPDDNRSNYEFDYKKYEDAVVMPWYRNQDQPQVSHLLNLFFCTQVVNV